MRVLALALAAFGLLANNAVDASNSQSKRSITARADASTVLLPGGSTVAIGTKRKETTFTTNSKDTFVKSSVISILSPLPARANVTVPPECENLSYLRYRHASGPSKSMSADRILSFMPGTLASAASFDQMARNIIFESKKLGQNVEVWSLARRASCLTDTYGVLQGVKQNDAQVTVDYYYNNKTVNGKNFVGFLQNKDDRLDFLAYQGVDQTTTDWYDLILKEIPDQTFRTTKHYASGHSLGGLLTGYFANYDADGDNTTTADAGYNQAAGFLAFDSFVRTSSASNIFQDPFANVAASNQSFADAQKGRISGNGARSLFTLLPIILTEDLAYYALTLGVIASTLPDTEVPSSLKPRTNGVKTALQASFSTDLGGYLVNGFTGLISWYDVRLTGRALLGALFGDRQQFIGGLQVSVGFPNSTKGMIDKLFFGGSAGAASGIGLLSIFDVSYPMACEKNYGKNSELYGWLNYDQIADDGSNVAKTQGGLGKPFVNSSVEVTDIDDFARSLAALPLPYIETYYPTRVTSDNFDAAKGAAEAITKNIHPEGYAKRPIINLIGGEGLVLKMVTPTDNVVISPGYNHLDTISASRKQNLGRQELVSINAAKFISALGTGVVA
ncbi:unnamed protein product [Tilletia laevis]|uniref:Uncharacterized protein n=2 Tax=Tilletia TaxID=13289 RepID=A0A177U8B1_9BASI|nr:hypothetical protein CF336_g5794 [Tilletia laevis]KAE8256915.1 hypothetical protein A4X03_0g4929 [Tilletia caries]KAE8202373.1 hypothetical protein CF335_g3442 [Tilletia laevis]CAD6884909.1 unnamed protein product [Tilletia caries]CAD6902107.1 unnamed protein product [Tilletia caries]